jgi:hypothetical protein
MLLALPGREFLLIDDDVIGEENISTSAYFSFQVGVAKVDALAEMLIRKGATANSRRITLKRPIWQPDALIVDTFDNSEARGITWHSAENIVHVGVGEGRTGEVTWDANWSPPEGPPRGENPVCTHLLGRSILRFTAVVAVGIIEEFLDTGNRRDAYVTAGMRIY